MPALTIVEGPRAEVEAAQIATAEAIVRAFGETHLEMRPPAHFAPEPEVQKLVAGALEHNPGLTPSLLELLAHIFRGSTPETFPHASASSSTIASSVQRQAITLAA